jgi:GntR family transcriptional regulator
MTLEAGGMPLHHQLYLVLRDQIAGGALAPGDPLPSEQELGVLYGVSRITVRRALQELSAESAVVKRPGRGTFVAEGTWSAASRAPATLRDALRQTHDNTAVDIVDYDRRLPSIAAVAALELDPTDSVIRVLRVRRIRSVPVMITEAWVPTRFADQVTEANLATTALYELLERSGVVLGRVIQEITAEIADPIRGALLRVAIGSALVRIDRQMRDSAGASVEFVSIWVTPSRTRIVAELPAIDVETVATGIFRHSVSDPMEDVH